MVAPNIGHPCGLEKINSRTIMTSKQPLSTEKAVPSVLWKEVQYRASPAGLTCRLEYCVVSRTPPPHPPSPVAYSQFGQIQEPYCLQHLFELRPKQLVPGLKSFSMNSSNELYLTFYQAHSRDFQARSHVNKVLPSRSLLLTLRPGTGEEMCRDGVRG